MKIVKLYLFKDNSKFYAEEKLSIPNTYGVNDLKDYLVNEYNLYVGMNIVVIPDENNFENPYPILVLRRDRKYGV